MRRSSRQRLQDGQNGPQPDPSEFEPEPEFTVGEDGSEPSRTSTPKPAEAQENAQVTKEDGGEPASAELPQPSSEKNGPLDGGQEEVQQQEAAPPTPELPKDVQAKLQRLAKLEDKYGQLLRAYKTAHARVQTIGPFEASLRENTPLTTITDPGALVEYLNQVALRGDMVMQELKRVTGDSEETKKKLEASEKEKVELQDEVMQLKDKMGRLPAMNGVATYRSSSNRDQHTICNCKIAHRCDHLARAQLLNVFTQS